MFVNNLYIITDGKNVIINPKFYNKEEYHAGRDIKKAGRDIIDKSEEPKSKKYIAIGILLLFICASIVALVILFAMIFLNFPIETGVKIILSCTGIDSIIAIIKTLIVIKTLIGEYR